MLCAGGKEDEWGGGEFIQLQLAFAGDEIDHVFSQGAFSQHAISKSASTNIAT